MTRLPVVERAERVETPRPSEAQPAYARRRPSSAGTPNMSTVTVGTTIPTPPPTAYADANELVEEQTGQDSSTMTGAGDEAEPFVASPSHHTSRKTTAPLQEVPLKIDLTEVEAKVRLIKDTYSNRSAPGLYIDPFAKRRIGQGRPRNAFIATFRLTDLSTLEWFTHDAMRRSEETDQTSARLKMASPVVNHAREMGDRSVVDNTKGAISDAALEIRSAVDDPSVRQTPARTPDALDTEPLHDESIPDPPLTSQVTAAVFERTEDRPVPYQDDARPLQQHKIPAFPRCRYKGC